MSDYRRRLGRLEVLWQADPEPEPSEEDRAYNQRLLEAITTLLGTMGPEHIERVAAEIKTGERSAPPDPGAVRLRRAVLELAGAHAHGLENFKLALPPAVAEIFLTDPSASLFEQCYDCRLVLPLGSDILSDPRGGRFVSSRVCFERCPECGGPNGRWDKWNGGPTMQRPEEKRAAFAPQGRS